MPPIPKSHVPFQLLRLYQRISPDPKPIYPFVRRPVLRWGVVSTSHNPQAGGPPLLGCTRLLIQNIRSYPPYWRPSLHPQPEDAPYHNDRDPLPTTGPLFCLTNIISTAIPPPVWPIGWMGNVNKINEQTESGKRYLSDNIMIICHVYQLTGNIASIGRYTNSHEQVAQGSSCCMDIEGKQDVTGTYVISVTISAYQTVV